MTESWRGRGRGADELAAGRLALAGRGIAVEGHLDLGAGRAALDRERVGQRGDQRQAEAERRLVVLGGQRLEAGAAVAHRDGDARVVGVDRDLERALEPVVGVGVEHRVRARLGDRDLHVGGQRVVDRRARRRRRRCSGAPRPRSRAGRAARDTRRGCRRSEASRGLRSRTEKGAYRSFPCASGTVTDPRRNLYVAAARPGWRASTNVRHHGGSARAPGVSGARPNVRPVAGFGACRQEPIAGADGPDSSCGVSVIGG